VYQKKGTSNTAGHGGAWPQFSASSEPDAKNQNQSGGFGSHFRDFGKLKRQKFTDEKLTICWKPAIVRIKEDLLGAANGMLEHPTSYDFPNRS